jgi:anti-anti-sigma factor
MSIKREEEDGCALVVIKGAMSVYEASDLHKELVACFEAHDRLILDLGEVNECDTAAVQLLCSAQKTAHASHKTFVVEGASASVLEALTRAGMKPEEIFNIKEEM